MTDPILTITNLTKTSASIHALDVTYFIDYNPATEVFDLTRGFKKTAPLEGYTVESFRTFALCLEFVWAIHYFDLG